MGGICSVRECLGCFMPLEKYVAHTDIKWEIKNKLFCDDYNENKTGGARGVMVIVVRNGHGDTSSNPERDWLHFT